MSLPITLDDYDVSEFIAVASRFGQGRFGYVVTPNVDHLLRYYDDPQFRDLYAAADYVLLDSRVIARTLFLTRGINPKVCPGSDLTERLFLDSVRPDDSLVLVGGTPNQAQALRIRFALRHLHHVNPPMGFVSDPVEVAQCLRQIEAAGPFRYCFLAVGCPQQEIIAEQLKARGNVRGLALCIGASVNFITGSERRAPRWVQRLGFEWLFRLLQDPVRLARRYLVRGPKVFLILPRMRFTLRRNQDDDLRV